MLMNTNESLAIVAGTCVVFITVVLCVAIDTLLF